MKKFLHHFSLLIGIVISGIFLYLTFKKSNFGEIASTLASVRYGRYIWSLMALALHLYLKSLRWQFILSSQKHISIKSSFSNIMIGGMANNLLPARLGEFVRIYSLAKTENLSKSSVFSALIVERLFDGYCLVLFLVIGLFGSDISLTPSVLLLIKQACVIALVIYSCILFALIFLKNYSTPLSHKLKQRKTKNRIINFLYEKLSLFLEGLMILKGLRSIATIAVLSFFVWITFVASTYFMMFMFGTNSQTMGYIVGFTGNVFLLGFVSIGIMIPASPGFIGTYEWFSKTVLMSFNINEPLIDSFIIFSHGSGYILFTFVGLVIFFRTHLSFKIIREQFRSKKI